MSCDCIAHGVGPSDQQYQCYKLNVVTDRGTSSACVEGHNTNYLASQNKLTGNSLLHHLLTLALE